MLSLLRPLYHATEFHSYHLQIFRDNDYLLRFYFCPPFFHLKFCAFPATLRTAILSLPELMIIGREPRNFEFQNY